MPNAENDHSLELKDLEEKLDLLIEQYNAIKNENHSLKVKQAELVKQKAKLLEKTTLAKTRVEAMISRLKSMEHGALAEHLPLSHLKFSARNTK
jgi:cell division protein ZapB